MKGSRGSIWMMSLLVVATALAGCGGGGEDSPVDPGGSNLSQSAADDIAVQASAGIVAGKGGWLAEVDAAAGMSGSSATAPLRLQMDVPVPSLSETTFTRAGITIRMTRRFFEENGTEVSGYGPTVDRLMSTCRAYGTHTGPGYSGSLGRTSWLDVHNLLASKDTLEFDGGSSDTVNSSFTAMDESHTHYFYWRSQGSLTDVRALKDQGVNPYPLSGTASWEVSVDVLHEGDPGSVEAHIDARVVVVFKGTSEPDLWVNGLYRYKVNLDTGLVTRA
jgi:hypothetical protein